MTLPHMLSPQEIFDTVARHLLAQGERSVTVSTVIDRSVCAYRGEGGRKCAIGCLVPDELYAPEMEGLTIDMLAESAMIMWPFHNIAKTDENIELMGDLQTVHDNTASWVDESRLRHELLQVAERHGLNGDALR